MAEKSLFERCKINTNIESDTFVGISCVDGEYQFSFPLGYHLEKDEKETRNDIFLLLRTLAKYTDKRESETHGNKSANISRFPIKEYLYVIKDFFERGYYKEVEIEQQVSRRGKINWSKTIKTQKPVIQEDEAYYLNFVTRKSNINENELITLTHKYCVYVSFVKIGWLFTSFVPPMPKIPKNKKILISFVFDKLQHTFNDRNRELFSAMIAILKEDGNESNHNFQYGTSRFEYVWQGMIDKAFGINNKSDYFPKTTWQLASGKKYDNACLEPDTIMITNGNVYVLDAKYYKFGWTGIPAHLPESTSINKQITYGEYIAEEYLPKQGTTAKVFNAFIMPYDSNGKTFPTTEKIHYVGTATSDWKTGEKEYENVVGILLDVKHLMTMDRTEADKETLNIANLIDSQFCKDND